MLPVSAAASARPAEQPMWSFSGGGGGSATVQAPLQFMSRVNYHPSPVAGVGAMSDTNLGMLAALNSYNRGGNDDHHQQQQNEQPEMDQQRGGDDDDGNEDDGNDDDSADNDDHATTTTTNNSQ